MTDKRSVLEILEFCGADHLAAEGTVGHALAVAGQLHSDLLAAAVQMNRLAKGPAGGVTVVQKLDSISRLDAAIRACGGGK